MLQESLRQEWIRETLVEVATAQGAKCIDVMANKMLT